MPSKVTQALPTTLTDATTLQQMGMHPLQQVAPPASIHQVPGGRPHPWDWLNPPHATPPAGQANLPVERKGQDHQQPPPVVSRLAPRGDTVIANESVGPPHGMVRPGIEILMCK
eukprot:16434612-Heterocapsa_arctica.AAC.1